MHIHTQTHTYMYICRVFRKRNKIYNYEVTHKPHFLRNILVKTFFLNLFWKFFTKKLNCKLFYYCVFITFILIELITY